MLDKLVFHFVMISVLLACNPTEAWYKQLSGPSYYSVGRASGLLSGVRRSPSVRRAELDPTDGAESASNSVISETSLQRFILKTMPACIKDIRPNLHSCELFQSLSASFKCKAEVFLSLDPSDCAED